MAIGRVARKLYSQQGEYGSVRKAYKEAFRRQMIANYAPANIIGRMFGFGSIFHTMAKRTFGTPEWNPRSLETGRPDADARMNFSRSTSGGRSMAGGGVGSRLAERSLENIEDNTERTADAMEKISNIAAIERKKEDISENFRRELEFEENLKKLRPLSAEKMTIGGPASKLGDLPTTGESGSSGFGFLGLPRGFLKPRNLLRFAKFGGLVGLAISLYSGISSGIEEYQKSGDFKEAISTFFSDLTFGIFDKAWWKENFVDPMADIIKNSVTIVGDLWQRFLNSDFMQFLKRPFQSTNQDAERERRIIEQGKQNEKFHSQAKHAGRKKVGKSRLIGGEPVIKMKIAKPPTQTSSSQFTKGGLANLGSVAGIPPEAQPLLNSIAARESGGDYGRIVGDGKFGGPARITDFSKHPGVAGVGLTAKTGGKWVGVNDSRAVITSSAAGKYQITKSTWNDLRKRYPDLTDFSPENQDKAAWYLAQERYAGKTGKDLLTSLKDGTFKPSVLASTWTSLPGGSEQTWKGEQQFMASMQAPGAMSAPMPSAPALNVPAATSATRATQMAATSAVGTTQIQAAMSTPESVGATIVGTMPTAAFGASPQMSESVDEFVTRVLVAMGVVTGT